jgi:hypothetical protein
VNSPHPATVPCGVVICVTDDQGSRAVEPETGRIAWTSAGWTPAGLLGGWIYAMPVNPRPAASAGGHPAPPPPALLAPDTGVPVLALTGWTPVPGTASPTDGAYVLRGTSPEVNGTEAIGVTWLALLHPLGRPWIEPLTPVPEVFGNGCAAADVYIVCETRENRLLAWHYEPGSRSAPGRSGT